MKNNYFKICFIFLVFILTIGGFSHLKSIYSIDRWSYLFYLNKDVETLIIGDSHTATALDPDIIKKSKNFSAMGETYFFTYFKLKQIIYKNPHIKNVIIGFTYHNISKMYGERYLYHKQTERELYNRYYILLNGKAKNKIKSFRKNFIIAFLKYDLGFPIQIYKDKFLFSYILGKKLDLTDFEFNGGFFKMEQNNVNIEDVKKRINDYFYNENLIYPGISNIEIEYLHKILDICQNKKINVFLYNSPVLPVYKNLIPNENIVDFEEVKDKILFKYKKVEYINHSDYELDEKYFGDGDHLNSIGAKVVSNTLYKQIKRL